MTPAFSEADEASRSEPADTLSTYAKERVRFDS